MSAPELPDDLKQWPRDPYQLLGTSPGISATDLRRVYTRLIRRFKPEQYPEHFRLIREAYDQVRFLAQFQTAPLPKDQETTRSMDNQPAEADGAVPLREWSRQERAENPDELWEQVCQGGREHEVYRRLEQCHERESREDVLPRLYWLARVFPELDGQRHACHWLAVGLRKNWNGPCRELYQREIERRPSEAFTERFTSLLATNAPLAAIADWLVWRWHAAGGLERWQLLMADLETMRPRFAGAEDITWARLLLVALDYLAWAHGEASAVVVQGIRAELEELVHVHSQLDLSRADILMDLAAAWKSLDAESCPAALLKIIPRTWNRSYWEIREPMMSLLEDLIADVDASLALCDDLNFKAPLVVWQLAQTVEGMQYHFNVLHSAPPSVGLERLLKSTFFESYTRFRVALIHLCYRDGLGFDQLMVALSTKAAAPTCVNEGYLHAVSEDWPLRLLCAAQRIFWA